MQPKCVTTTYEQHCKKCQTDKGRCSWRGKSCKVIEGEVTITSKRSRGQLVSQADESSSGDEVQEVKAPRGKFQHLYLALQLIERSGIHRLMTSETEDAGTRAVNFTGEGTTVQGYQATQKVREVEPTREKLKGKGKAKVINEAMEKVRRERLEKLRSERAIIQEMIDQLEW
jgi:hypothetical protein